uniref:Uncharacterized protein n=1 Tax=Rhizophora mucronata TaxID=61149 RepID=A0A2P2PV07_RHIMU
MEQHTAGCHGIDPVQHIDITIAGPKCPVCWIKIS